MGTGGGDPTGQSERPLWHDAAPGPDLAHLLDELDVEGLGALGDFDLVEVTAAAQRVSSWAHHLAARAAGTLAERGCMNPEVPGHVSESLTPTRIAGEEVAMRLGWTPGAGQQLVREGKGYDGHLYATGEALRAGRIDPHKARAIVDGLEGVPIELALGVQDMVLPRAPQRTAGQLAADVRAAIVELDPPEAIDRRATATTRRRVSKPVPLGDGMAGLWLRSGAIDVTALYEAIDRSARSARARGDSRTLDQLRADLLVERGLHQSTCTGNGAPSILHASRDAEAASPLSQASDRARREGAAPGDNVPRPRTGTETAVGGGTGGRCTTAVRTDVRVLVPLSTLLGSDDEAALLEGYGPIDPDLARALARGGVWRRLVTDPASGTVLDVGRTKYTPPADLAEHVRFRDLACVRPGCGTSAWHSELDHISPFGHDTKQGGPTSADNLAPLSKGCHQIKTHGGFQLERTSNNSYRWTTPTGHTYDVDPPPPLRALDPDDPVHEARADLEHLARETVAPTKREPPEPEMPRPEPPSGGSDPPPF